ncbi:MAG: tRNA 4-thiouridine(8) synthase ThiI [Thermodesulfobacterium geofontis]|uniref:tRNA 4-thiouridine(8) synthase ThiI n=1 Tax=Thermodesulfobacterium geofontis TaxID=1295609 RepID=A0A2N7PNF4_9BACT|nr:MAG: tRNA 4-thiouridine(8) synthase ThiI [Thermodesulfobacterium geofontis]PMP93499.1 MAG: tRNA 4-thiouridine(8) synthase ThiI [Thermodesulfobacterium geofontis]
MPKALLLFSEGLDSHLAGLILKEQDIKIVAVKFITPFFGWKYKENSEPFYEKIKELGFDEGILVDITEEFLEILKKPQYGYGDYANPCVDCKILMLKKAKELMKNLKTDFIATGEVLGQRPMSQNKNTLDLIEEKSGVKGILLRPLSAKLLAETEVEKRGLVDRRKLLDICGRKRTAQLELAKKFHLKEIPTPAGGCLLTDPRIGERVLRVLKEKRILNYKIAQLLILGRHFFEEGFWIVLGRNREENEKIKRIAENSYKIYTLNAPAPLAVVVEGNPPQDFIKNLLVKYSKKAKEKIAKGEEVFLTSQNV